jgi:hypothetical protein
MTKARDPRVTFEEKTKKCAGAIHRLGRGLADRGEHPANC